MVDWIRVDASKTVFAVSEVDEIKRAADVLCATVEREFALLPAPNNSRMICYVTLASPSYEWGLRVLLRSLRKVSQVPVIVLSSQRWIFECSEPNVLFVEVPGLNNVLLKPQRDEFRETLTKLWVFGLTCFRRVTFVDVDCLFLRSIDDLFDLDDFVCGADYVVNSTERGFNSGLLSFEPTRELRDYIFEQAPHTPSRDGGDQGLLNELLRSRVRLLPPEYDVLRHFHHYGGVELKRSEVRMIHYIVKKPWELGARESLDLALADLDDLWTSQLTHDELLELVASWRRTVHISRWNAAVDAAARQRRARRRQRTRIIITIAAILLGLVFFYFGYIVGGAHRV